MVWIDYAIIAVIAFSLVSLIRGFVREALSLVHGLGRFVASHYHTPPVSLGLRALKT